jgi:hypothetical protein
MFQLLPSKLLAFPRLLINDNYIVYVVPLLFSIVLSLSNRRNSSIPLWNSLFICNDCGLIPCEDGTFHTDILKATGKTLNFHVCHSIQAYSLKLSLFKNVTLPYKKPFDVSKY